MNILKYFCIVCFSFQLSCAGRDDRGNESPSLVDLPHIDVNSLVIVDGGRLNSFRTFGYVIGCTKTKKAALVDPGGRSDFLLQLSNEHNLTVQLVLLTHEHLDHVAEVDSIVQMTGAKVYLHADGLGMYRTFGVPVPFAENTFYDIPWVRSQVQDLASFLLSQTRPQSVSSSDSRSPPFNPPDKLINDGDVIEVGELRLRVVHVPGHSPGSVAYIEDKAGIIFSGDVAMGGVVGLTHLPGCSSFSMLSSLKRFKSEISNATSETVLFTGHSWPILAHTELERNKFLNSEWKFFTTHMLPNMLTPIIAIAIPMLLLRLGTLYINDLRN